MWKSKKKHEIEMEIVEAKLEKQKSLTRDREITIESMDKLIEMYTVNLDRAKENISSLTADNNALKCDNRRHVENIRSLKEELEQVKSGPVKFERVGFEEMPKRVVGRFVADNNGVKPNIAEAFFSD
jgi:hypothetical protein